MKKYFYAAAAAMLPMAALAQTQLSNVDTAISRIRTIINELIPVIIGLAVLFFIYALLKYVLSASDAEAQGQARQLMIWGVIIIFVMTAVWGLVGFVANTIDLPSTQVQYPQV